MATFLENLQGPETARNLALLLGVLVLALRPLAALITGNAPARTLFEFLVCGVGLLALLRFDAAMMAYAASAFSVHVPWLQIVVPGLAAAIYAATWSLLFGSFIPWVFQRSDLADAPQTWRERFTGCLLAGCATYLVAFFVAPLPSALDQALMESRLVLQSETGRARDEHTGQRLVAADLVCTAARSLYLDARTSQPATASATPEQVASHLDRWRVGEGLPGFGVRAFQHRCADVIMRKHPAQVQQVMAQLAAVSSQLRTAGVASASPQWPVLAIAGAGGASSESRTAVDLSAYVRRTFTDPEAQVRYALTRTDGATIFQLVMELVLLSLAWPASRIGRAPEPL